MKDSQPLVLQQMCQLADRWEQDADQRAVFIRCYSLMTQNMLKALEQGEFQDRVWVDSLLRHFADYYFTALQAYEQDPRTAPPVWRLAFDMTREPAAIVFQHLLLGVNAHINYDLVLTLKDVLGDEWATLEPERREMRRTDYERVNQVIGKTIDAVQDQVVDPAIPAMGLVDKLMGPTDEWLISHLITHWRDDVWKKGIQLVEANPQNPRALLVREIEAETLKRGQAILLRDGWSTIRDFL